MIGMFLLRWESERRGGGGEGNVWVGQISALGGASWLAKLFVALCNCNPQTTLVKSLDTDSAFL